MDQLLASVKKKSPPFSSVTTTLRQFFWYPAIETVLYLSDTIKTKTCHYVIPNYNRVCVTGTYSIHASGYDQLPPLTKIYTYEILLSNRGI